MQKGINVSYPRSWAANSTRIY